VNHFCNQTFSIKCLQIEKLSSLNFLSFYWFHQSGEGQNKDLGNPQTRKLGLWPELMVSCRRQCGANSIGLFLFWNLPSWNHNCYCFGGRRNMFILHKDCKLSSPLCNLPGHQRASHMVSADASEADNSHTRNSSSVRPVWITGLLPSFQQPTTWGPLLTASFPPRPDSNL
jgi:hypothetical protein